MEGPQMTFRRPKSPLPQHLNKTVIPMVHALADRIDACQLQGLCGHALACMQQKSPATEHVRQGMTASPGCNSLSPSQM